MEVNWTRIDERVVDGVTGLDVRGAMTLSNARGRLVATICQLVE
jgi:hypothetical protein